MIVVAYGANLDSRFGNPTQTFEIVLKEFHNNGLNIIDKSDLWDTSPVGTSEDQPSYTNAVIRIETSLNPVDLLALLLNIEKEMGRDRSFKNAPRPVDLDLIDYDGMVRHENPNCILPHPRMHLRKFVLVPLAQIDDGWTHPVSGAKIHDLIQSCSDDQYIAKIT